MEDSQSSYFWNGTQQVCFSSHVHSVDQLLFYLSPDFWRLPERLEVTSFDGRFSYY